MDTGEGAHRLVLVRHAKAEPYAASDFERALTERGRADAGALGRLLRQQGIVPDAAFVSAARRALETWEALTAAAGWDLEAQVDRSLYAAEEDSVLDALAVTEESLSTAVVVGHNPTIALLAQLLDDGHGAPEAMAGLAAGYPTSAATLFELRCPWREVTPGCGRLLAFHVGRADAPGT